LLAERGWDEICHVCWWEDDGIDDEIWPSGCNSGVRLAEARHSFAQTTWYHRLGDPRTVTLGAGVPEIEVRRRAIVAPAAQIHDFLTAPC
jgi:hypothetical protein